MDIDEVIRILKSFMNYEDGSDYYAYDYEPHWWIEDDQLEPLAKEIVDRG